jgi:hypothetical protein
MQEAPADAREPVAVIVGLVGVALAVAGMSDVPLRPRVLSMSIAGVCLSVSFFANPPSERAASQSVRFPITSGYAVILQ